MSTFPPLPDWVQLEHQVAQILQQQEEHGWYFNEREAYELESTLRGELEEATEVLRRKYGFVAGAVFTPKRNNRTQGYVQGCPFTKLKQLNPTSRDHIAWILQTHENWKPTQRTATGKPDSCANDGRAAGDTAQHPSTMPHNGPGQPSGRCSRPPLSTCVMTSSSREISKNGILP